MILKLRSLTRAMLAPAIRRGRAMGRNEDGAVAIEFGILALPFFTVIYAILETSMTFFAQQILESALQDSSRFIRTGQAQSAEWDWDSDDFRDAVCDGLYGMFDCDNDDRFKIKVRVVSSFASATVSEPVGEECVAGADEAACNWTITSSYDDGKGSDVILVEAYYKWPTILNLPGFNFANQAGNNRLLGAARVFKNEPF